MSLAELYTGAVKITKRSAVPVSLASNQSPTCTSWSFEYAGLETPKPWSDARKLSGFRLAIRKDIGSIWRSLAEWAVHANLKTIDCAGKARIRRWKGRRTGIEVRVGRQRRVTIPGRRRTKSCTVHLRNYGLICVRE